MESCFVEIYMCRHLLTHSSGLGYHTMDPRYIKWRTSRGEDCGIKGWSIIPRINTPLLFEPGTGWAYGTGLDWAGILISRLNNMTLEQYMKKYIWSPLGIRNITFHQENEGVRRNLVKMSIRKGIKNPILGLPVRNGETVEWTDHLLYDVPIADEFGGEGAIGSPVEYMKILHSILADDGVLLRSETIDEMFTPQLSEGGGKALDEYIALPFYQGGAFACVKAGTKVSWGLGGLLFLEDYEETGRRKGTLTWSGMPNLMWTIDREAGLCTLYAGNVLPFGDFPSGDMQVRFEREMYARAEKSSRL
jgi:CubicO group peptidase (beta-lactamase class C family)